jgi:hypothetical protein
VACGYGVVAGGGGSAGGAGEVVDGVRELARCHIASASEFTRQSDQRLMACP